MDTRAADSANFEANASSFPFLRDLVGRRKNSQIHKKREMQRNVKDRPSLFASVGGASWSGGHLYETVVIGYNQPPQLLEP